ncbi:hypothetical protein [Jonesia quinghaiensis]|uniref:hypothetical protein n=1 Tax=Jonesia quinghaiensis TaxID=262806 RepID=UPI0003F4ECD8|nr:hypothetical protein [Jonesia quinghaiensis]
MYSRNLVKNSVLVAVLVVSLAACGTGSSAQDDMDFPHTETQLDGYPEALLIGDLVIEKVDDSYCPRVESEEGTTHLLVLPPSAKVDANSVTVGDQVRNLGAVEVGGGVMGGEFDDAGCERGTEPWLVSP